jgi:hypothetical protein
VKAVSHVASAFFIAAGDAPRALAALVDFVEQQKKPHRFALDAPGLAAATDLPSALAAIGLAARVDRGGDLVGLRWSAPTLPSDGNHLRKALEPLAPFVPFGYLVLDEGETRPIELLFCDGKVKRGYWGQTEAEIERRLRNAEKAARRKQVDAAA